jgi:hypothetical protein
MRTRFSLNVERGELLAWRHDGAAGKALSRLRFLQLRIECGAMIKDEAITLVVRPTDFFEVFENATFELVHAVVADVLHMDRCFFTAYAAGAEGNDGFIVQGLFFALDDGREIAEFFDAVVNRVFEGTHIDFEGIAGVHHDDRLALIIMTLIQPAFERRGFDCRCSAQLGLDQRVLHGDDFALESDQHAIERLLLGQAFLDLDIGEPGVRAQEGQKLIYRGARSCKKKVNALRAEQNRSFEAQIRAQGLKTRALGDRVIERNKFISSDIDDLRQGLHGGSNGSSAIAIIISADLSQASGCLASMRGFPAGKIRP